ncbi:PREDICTED: LOW QUALITY PROTEIN: uncharacterized protein LOC108546140 [Eufriesea mexicana]|uniref:LOW QUALITY PROTEIN: uncharacterized protein LOC108546140 n=1 Tax=Eufriesea mexicana TaxID=516756 RepID=UPI00083C2457|nr:PREDICTED: LOW QUALITY PROTEIN: uncharacterized protein LOC108546140 [Eufriesea mexicana]
MDNNLLDLKTNETIQEDIANLEKLTQSYLLLKKRISGTHELIKQYNDKLKECERSKQELDGLNKEVKKITCNYNSTLAKVIKLELQNTEYKKNIKILTTQVSEHNIKAAADKQHIQQLICKIKDIEANQNDKIMQYDLEKSSLQVKVKELEQELKNVKKSYDTKMKKMEKKVPIENENKVKLKDAAINTILTKDIIMQKPEVRDKSVLTNEFYNVKNNLYPVFCGKCEILLEPPPIEKICKVMSNSCPKLIEKISSPIKRSQKPSSMLQMPADINSERYRTESLPTLSSTPAHHLQNQSSHVDFIPTSLLHPHTISLNPANCYNNNNTFPSASNQGTYYIGPTAHNPLSMINLSTANQNGHCESMAASSLPIITSLQKKIDTLENKIKKKLKKRKSDQNNSCQHYHHQNPPHMYGVNNAMPFNFIELWQKMTEFYENKNRNNTRVDKPRNIKKRKLSRLKRKRLPSSHIGSWKVESIVKKTEQKPSRKRPKKCKYRFSPLFNKSSSSSLSSIEDVRKLNSDSESNSSTDMSNDSSNDKANTNVDSDSLSHTESDANIKVIQNSVECSKSVGGETDSGILSDSIESGKLMQLKADTGAKSKLTMQQQNKTENATEIKSSKQSKSCSDDHNIGTNESPMETTVESSNTLNTLSKSDEYIEEIIMFDVSSVSDEYVEESNTSDTLSELNESIENTSDTSWITEESIEKTNRSDILLKPDERISKTNSLNILSKSDECVEESNTLDMTKSYESTKKMNSSNILSKSDECVKKTNSLNIISKLNESIEATNPLDMLSKSDDQKSDERVKETKTLNILSKSDECVRKANNLNMISKLNESIEATSPLDILSKSDDQKSDELVKETMTLNILSKSDEYVKKANNLNMISKLNESIETTNPLDILSRSDNQKSDELVKETKPLNILSKSDECVKKANNLNMISKLNESIKKSNPFNILSKPGDKKSDDLVKETNTLNILSKSYERMKKMNSSNILLKSNERVKKTNNLDILSKLDESIKETKPLDILSKSDDHTKKINSSDTLSKLDEGINKMEHTRMLELSQYSSSMARIKTSIPTTPNSMRKKNISDLYGLKKPDNRQHLIKKLKNLFLSGTIMNTCQVTPERQETQNYEHCNSNISEQKTVEDKEEEVKEDDYIPKKKPRIAHVPKSTVVGQNQTTRSDNFLQFKKGLINNRKGTTVIKNTQRNCMNLNKSKEDNNEVHRISSIKIEEPLSKLSSTYSNSNRNVIEDTIRKMSIPNIKNSLSDLENKNSFERSKNNYSKFDTKPNSCLRKTIKTKPESNQHSKLLKRKHGNNCINVKGINGIDKMSQQGALNSNSRSSINTLETSDVKEMNLNTEKLTNNVCKKEEDFTTEYNLKPYHPIIKLQQYVNEIKCIKTKRNKNQSAKLSHVRSVVDKFVEIQLQRLIDSDWESSIHWDVIKTLQSTCSACIIAKGIIDFLSKEVDHNHVLDNTYTPPAPLMAKAQQRISALLVDLEKSKPTIIQIVQAGIEYKLFRLNQPIERSAIESLSRMYTVLARIRKDREKVRIFCCDALYCLGINAVIILYTVLTCWPEVFPNNDTNAELLPRCMAHLILEQQGIDFPKLNALKNLISIYYKYPMGTLSADILKELLMAIQKNSHSNVETAIILLAKREGTEWAYKNVVKGALLSMIVNNKLPNTYRAFSLLGNLMRVFPIEDKDNAVGEIVEQLSDLIISGEGSDEQKEGVISALLSLARHKFQEVVPNLLKWTPAVPLCDRTSEQIRGLVNIRDIVFWQNYLRKRKYLWDTLK